MREDLKDFNIINVNDFDISNLNVSRETFRLKKCEYYNIPFSFDIETTSTYYNDNKIAFMYIWQCAIGEYVIVGRYWIEWVNFCNKLSEYLELNKKTRIICLVHNLSYEFHFMQEFFEWEHIFARKKKKPMLALTSIGIEFRCTMVLSGYSLEKLAENYTPIRKLKGDLDYSLIRHNETNLLKDELAYCYNDVKILYHYWNYLYSMYISKNPRNAWLPLTQTSVVRQHCKNSLKEYCKKENKSFSKYHKAIESCSIHSETMYTAFKNAYIGGYTHANFIYVNKVIHNLGSFDFKSSYPAVMFNSYYPMTNFVKKDKPSYDFFNDCIKNKCCISHIILFDVKDKKYNHILSKSKLINYDKDSFIEDNGRLVECKFVELWCTELDFKLIKMFYNCSKMFVEELYYAEKGRLPQFLITSLVEFYKGKNELKHVKGKELEYLHSKELLNALYGMCVTDIVNLDITFENGLWNDNKNLQDVNKKLNDNAKSNSQFLLYQWGIWVCAHARYNLLKCLSEIDIDGVYCDTDSIKINNPNKWQYVIDKFNAKTIIKNQKAIKYYNLENEYKLLYNIGIWDKEDNANEFKTLGAKKYIKNGEITVSGLNKKSTNYYIRNVLHENPIDCFNIDFIVPPEYSGRRTLTYFDNYFCCDVTDYLGKTKTVNATHYVHMENASYSLGITQTFADFISDGAKI